MNVAFWGSVRFNVPNIWQDFVGINLVNLLFGGGVGFLFWGGGGKLVRVL